MLFARPKFYFPPLIAPSPISIMAWDDRYQLLETGNNVCPPTAGFNSYISHAELTSLLIDSMSQNPGTFADINLLGFIYVA